MAAASTTRPTRSSARGSANTLDHAQDAQTSTKEASRKPANRAKSPASQPSLQAQDEEMKDDQDEDDDNDDDTDKNDVKAPPTAELDSQAESGQQEWAGLSDHDNVQDKKKESNAKPNNAVNNSAGIDDTASLSDTSEQEFDVPDDDDDYNGVMDVDADSEASDDIEALDVQDMAKTLDSDQAWKAEEAAAQAIDWDAQSTYGFADTTPYSGDFDYSLADSPLHSSDPMRDPFSSVSSVNQAKASTAAYDPHLSRSLVGDDWPSSDGSASSRNSSPVITREQESAATNGDAAAQDSDTDEETPEEFARKCPTAFKFDRPAHKSSKARKNKRSKTKRKSSSPEAVFKKPSRALVKRKFIPSPDKAVVWSVMTSRGTVIRIKPPTRGRISFIEAKVGPSAASFSPTSPELAELIKSRLFQSVFCANEPGDVLFRRSNTGSSGFGRGFSYRLPVDSGFGAASSSLALPLTFDALDSDDADMPDEDDLHALVDFDGGEDDSTDGFFTPGGSLESPSPSDRFQELPDLDSPAGPDALDTPAPTRSRKRKPSIDPTDSADDSPIVKRPHLRSAAGIAV